MSLQHGQLSFPTTSVFPTLWLPMSSPQPPSLLLPLSVPLLPGAQAAPLLQPLALLPQRWAKCPSASLAGSDSQAADFQQVRFFWAEVQVSKARERWDEVGLVLAREGGCGDGAGVGGGSSLPRETKVPSPLSIHQPSPPGNTFRIPALLSVSENPRSELGPLGLCQVGEPAWHGLCWGTRDPYLCCSTHRPQELPWGCPEWL